jgi:predicted RNA binding protein YcfA (HicA-like mRNA interferase family)
MCNNYQKLERLIQKKGYSLLNHKSHLVYEKEGFPNISLPKRKSRELSLKTMGKILKVLGLSIKEFKSL